MDFSLLVMVFVPWNENHHQQGFANPFSALLRSTML
jgi:hypothetical protein